MTEPRARYGVYEYRVLRNDSVRVVELLPGSPQDDLRIRILHVLKSAELAYEALSYTWGEPKFDYDAFEERSGRVVHITLNLRDALLALRSTSKSRVMWIDAICINQLNNRERGYQVAHMGDIFANATCVIVWLGRPQRFESTAETDTIRNIALLARAKVYAELTRTQYTHAKFVSGPVSKKALYHFLARPWFERVWTVQEFVLAREVYFQIGTQVLDYSSFKQAILLLGSIFDAHAQATNIISKRVPVNLRQAQHDVRKVYQLVTLREDMYRSDSPREHLRQPQVKLASSRIMIRSLFGCVMNISRCRDCADPRDRVYAMLGLIDEVTLIVPDYTKPVRQVYLDFTKHCMSKGDLSILHECARAHERAPQGDSQSITGQSERELPSFVPVLGYDATPHSLFTLGSRDAMASAGSLYAPQVEFQFDGTVSISGVEVDTITETSPFNERLPWQPLDNGYFGKDRGYPFEEIISWQSLIQHMTGHHYLFSRYTTRSRSTKVSLSSVIEATRFYFSSPQDTSLMDHYLSGKSVATSFCCGLYEYRSRPKTPGAAMPDWISQIFATHKVFRTALGHMGVGPAGLCEGDHVVIFDGARTPFVLRPDVDLGSRVTPPSWTLVGDAYLLGWMDGRYFGHEVDGGNCERHQGGAESVLEDEFSPAARILRRRMFVLR